MVNPIVSGLKYLKLLPKNTFLLEKAFEIGFYHASFAFNTKADPQYDEINEFSVHVAKLGLTIDDFIESAKNKCSPEKIRSSFREHGSEVETWFILGIAIFSATMCLTMKYYSLNNINTNIVRSILREDVDI